MEVFMERGRDFGEGKKDVSLRGCWPAGTTTIGRRLIKFYLCRYLKSFPPEEAPGAEHRRADHTSYFRRQTGRKNNYAFILSPQRN